MDEPRHGHGPITREKLIEAAGETFAEKGLHGASIRDITQRAGANIASVNYHFHDKFELYALVLRQAHESVAEPLKQLVDTGPPEQRLRQFLSAILTSAFDPARPPWHRKLLSRELVEPTPALDLMRDLMDHPCQRLSKIVREIRPDLSEQRFVLTVAGIAAQFLFHVHHGHLTQRMFPDVPQPSIDTLVDHMLEFSLAALRGLPENGAPAPAGRRMAGHQSVARPSARARKRKSPRTAG